MKQTSLVIFILILITCSYSMKHLSQKEKSEKKNQRSSSKITKKKSQKIMKKTEKKESQKEEKKEKEEIKEIEIYFQKVYSGSNPLQIINLSQKSFKRYIISVNAQIIVLKTLPDEINLKGEVFDTAVLKDIYDAKIDKAEKNKCCSRVQFYQYQECSGDCSKTGLEGFQANNCLEIKVAEFSWRICSENKAVIQSLDFQIRTAIIKLFNKNIDYKDYIEKSFVNKRSISNWDWHNQLTWGGNCDNSEINLQSPIILDNPEDENVGEENKGASEKVPELNIDYYFNSIEPVVTSYGREIIVGFPSFIGLMKLKVDDKEIVYQPNFLAFRFKSEHQIASKRFDGEIEVHFTEVNPDKKSWLTNGLVVSIFLEQLKETKSLKFLESLKLDYWKLELKEKKNSTYKPGNSFCLQSLFDELFKLDPKYYIYKGSITTPPCTSNVLRLVFDKSIKIPEIQFKVLREQSLLDLKEKEIHARITQKALQRDVVKGTCKNIAYNKNLENYLETSLSAEFLAGSKATSESISGDNIFSPARKETLRDAVIKYNTSESIETLERRLSQAKQQDKNVVNTSKQLVSGNEDCGR